MLAGILELIPSVKQWHNEPSAEFGGLRLGDYFETFVDGECHALGGRKAASSTENGDAEDAPRRPSRRKKGDAAPPPAERE